MLLFLIMALMGNPTAVDADGICEVFTKNADIAEGGFEVCKLVVIEADKQGLDPFFAAAVAWKESRFAEFAVGDGGSSFGPMQLHMRWHCDPPSPRWKWKSTAEARARKCDLIGDGVGLLKRLSMEPRKKRTKVLPRYRKYPMLVPKSMRHLYHAAAVYKGGPKPGESAHKSAWRVLAHMRKAKAKYAGREMARR